MIRRPPKSRSTDTLIPYTTRVRSFQDTAVEVVQTPQHFLNPDPMQQRNKGHLDLPDEQRYFFDTLLPAKDGWGTAFSCGTSSVVRTGALARIGGFPTASITEDMLLSLRMKEHG